MFYLPVSLLLFFMLVLLLPFLWLGLAVDVVALAVGKLGFSREGALLLLLAILVGSSVNIPLYRVKCEVTLVEDLASLWMRQFWGIPLAKISQETVVALNVGGGLIPVLLALYQFGRADGLLILAVTALVTVVSYYASHVVPGIGIQMNPLIAPTTAALAALFWAGDQAPAVAFAGGVLGTVIGADLLHLPEVLRRNCSGILSIGGAGVFDGIALCGLFALLLS
ncbi:DUF1614 domain-containing protein [Synechococcus sp. H55.8]|uniref:DUF1614 domain-containing protein n=1 Tax=Synechococcus sp. H55.8 TaxID=2964510 RepID=UPI0039C1A587